MKKFLKTMTLAALIWLSSVGSPVCAQTSPLRLPPIKIKRMPMTVAAQAYSEGRGAWLEWKTENESKNLGFLVYRVVGDARELVSRSLVVGAYLQTRLETPTAGSYSFFDRDGDANSVYVIESRRLDSQKLFTEPIRTQYVSDLRAVAGFSSEELQNQARAAAPSVFRNDSILPEDLTIEAASGSLPPDPVTQRWVAAQPGARIGVKVEGFYRVSRAELQTAGFDVAAPPNRWQLYVNGVEQAISVGGSGDYIEFYGRGIETLDADTQIYFLVVGATDCKRIGNTIRPRVSGSVVSNSYLQSFSKKERTVYLQALLNGDAENIFGSYIGAEGAAVNFDLSGVDYASPNASIDLTLQGVTRTAHRTKIYINNTEIGVLSGSDFNAMTGNFTFPTAILNEGANILRMTTLNNVPGGIADNSLFDALKISFARRYLARQNRLAFYVPNYKTVYVENFASPAVRVFDTTNADAPILINGLTVEASNGAFRVNVPSNRGRVLSAVENSGLLTVASISANEPSTLSTAAHRAEFIIVTHKDFTAQANTWANYRRASGLSVEVVNVEDVYDEFNYGAVSADCLKNFLDYAKNNWQTAPKYVLLLGDASSDPKNYLGAGGNFLPTKLVDTTYSEAPSDAALADFNDDGLAEIAVGRMPFRTAADVTLAFAKLNAFEQNVAQAHSRGALFASDLPDGYDFEGASRRLCAELPPTIGCVEINRAQPNSAGELLTTLNQGKFLVNYAGHGNAAVWATPGFFSVSQAAQLNSGGSFSMFTMLTCLNGYFVQPNDSLSEILLKNPNGGAVAAWASSGLTAPNIQEIMATRFFNQVGAGSITRLGDLVRDAKTTINSGRDVRLSWVLLGDPAMKVK